MKRTLLIAGGTALSILGWLAFHATQRVNTGIVQAASVQAPRFEVDPLWPKPLPNHWVLGMTIGVTVDPQDHIWIIHRPASIDPYGGYAAENPPRGECCAAAPNVLEFDQAGNLLRHWGGPGEGYDWPLEDHGITADSKGNLWLAASGRVVPCCTPPPPTPRVAVGQSDVIGYAHDNMVLKFSPDGKFLLQIGKPSQSKGSNDVENVRLATKAIVDPKTNELYVADGYGNHRVIVYDAETGKYKRHWGAYGNKPSDIKEPPYNPDSPPSKQFNTVHCVALSNDNLLYVCDRVNDRIQVFKPDGTFVKEMIIAKNTRAEGSVWDIEFSKDPQQKYMYVADGVNEKIRILLRDTLQEITAFGDGGLQPGEFHGVHNIAVDSKGNIYTTETSMGRRVQRFMYKGLAPVTAANQGVVWPKASAK